MKPVLKCIACLGMILSYVFSPLISQANDSDSLVFAWKIKAVSASDSSWQVSDTDRFQLNADGTFHYSLQVENRHQAGKWQVIGDSLILQLERLPVVQGIDSLVYQVTEDQPQIIYYQQGKEIARQSGENIESQRREKRYHISWQENQQVVLENGESRFLLQGRQSLKQLPLGVDTVLRTLLGLACLLGIAYLLSDNRKAVNWYLVGMGVFLQVVFAILVLKIPRVKNVFDWFSSMFVQLLNFTSKGSEFIFGDLITNTDSFGFIFAFQILPTIIFFSALTSILYYLGLLQRIVYGFAWIMSKTMRLSGAESLAAAGNIFLGQTEAPLLIKPYLDKMTRSEIMSLMTGGMATIAGGVFAAYIGYLGGADPVQQQIFATHLLTASIMSAPAALVTAKLLVPETQPILKDLRVPQDKIGSNLLDAISNGTSDGLRLAVNVGVMLLIFIALTDMLNYGLMELIGNYTGLNTWIQTSTEGRYEGFTLQYILGLVFAPVAWILGTPTEDIVVIGQLLGEKTIINEFVAYVNLGIAKEAGNLVYFKSVIIATYALCGFANLASMGIQIGGIGALAPGQRKQLASLGIKSLIGGTIAAFMTATIAGMLVNL